MTIQLQIYNNDYFKTNIEIDLFDDERSLRLKFKQIINPLFSNFILFPKNMKALQNEQNISVVNLMISENVSATKMIEVDIENKKLNFNKSVIDNILENYEFNSLSSETEQLYLKIITKIFLCDIIIKEQFDPPKKKSKLPSRLPSSVKSIKKPTNTTTATSEVTNTTTATSEVTNKERIKITRRPITATTSSGEEKKIMIKKPMNKKIKTSFFLEDFTINFEGSDLILRKDEIVMVNKTYKKFLNTQGMEKNVKIAYIDRFLQTPYIQNFRKELKSYLRVAVGNETNKILNLLSVVENENIKLQNQIQEINNYNQKFMDIQPLESNKLEDIGQIVELEIQTKNYSTGSIFNNLELNNEYSLATYKDFYKFHIENKIKTNNTNNTNSDLIIFRYDEKRYRRKFQTAINEDIEIHIANKKKGLKIQVLLRQDSSIFDIEELFKFLKIAPEKVSIKNSNTIGYIGNTKIQNNKPEGYRGNWASFQRPILANLIMNNNFFRKFLLVNDSDKISRDNNILYLYFNYESRRTGPTIKVGGWNKLSSRFGILTAVINPILENDNDYVNIKILRSDNKENVVIFLEILGKLLKEYNDLLASEIRNFQTYFPKYRPYSVMEQTTSSKKDKLQTLRPDIFLKSIYPKSCQSNHHPPIILNKEQTDNVDSSRILKFPDRPVTIKNKVYQPDFYYCYDKTYKYPGFIKMNLQGNYHPFNGIAPCCYKEDHKDKNEQALNDFHKLRETNSKINDQELEIKKTPYFLRSDKRIIVTMGQRGMIPEKINKLLININPYNKYFRIGLDKSWHNSSLIGCCEYIRQEKNNGKFLPKQKDLRYELSKIPLEIIKQENFNNDLGSVFENLVDINSSLNVRNFLSLINEFYQINILVLDMDGNFILPNSLYSFKPNLLREQPLLLLLENNGVYEIIASEKEQNNNEEEYYMCQNFISNDIITKQWFYIYNQIYVNYTNNSILDNTTDLSINFLNNLNINIDKQILSGNGQCRAVVTKDIILFSLNLFKPLAIQNCKNIEIPQQNNVLTFIESIKSLKDVKIEIKEKKYKQYLLYYLNDMFVIPCVDEKDKKNDTNDQIESQIISFLSIFDNNDSFNTIGKMKQYSNMIIDYILIAYSRFHKITNDLKQKQIISNMDQIIEVFTNTCIEWVDEVEYDDNLNCFIDNNQTIYNSIENKLYVPKSLEKNIIYSLRWHISNNSNLDNILNSNELYNFYNHCFQFKSIKDNILQKSQYKTDINNYSSYYKFPNNKLSIFNNYDLLTTYFLQNEKTNNLYIFFFIKNTALIEEKVTSVVEQYFRTGILKYNKKDLRKKSKNIKYSEIIPDNIVRNEIFIVDTNSPNIKGVIFNF